MLLKITLKVIRKNTTQNRQVLILKGRMFILFYFFKFSDKYSSVPVAYKLFLAYMSTFY